ncbi:glutathione S-transferase family protein [Candidatus Binatia bacterium]|jgi:glutathione S-transferase|nr:glutathione S-transferase family protein [Candidatus Binatia bacterium]
MIRIYGKPRSRTVRCLWMAEEIGLAYENVKTDFERGEARTPEFLRLNPNGHVPALEDGDVRLFESLAINLYLARRYGGALWPRDVADEGRAFQWSIWAMTELEEPLLTALVNRRFLPEARRDAQRAARAAERAQKPLGVLEGALDGRSWLVGDAFGVADLNVASVLVWAPMADIDLAATPRVAAWLGRCTARPAFARAQAA